MDREIPERCPVCGTVSPLERVHILAMNSTNGEPRENNVIWLCPNCHYEMDRGSLRGFEFESVLARLMKSSGQFEADSVVQDALVVGRDRQNRIDIKAIAKGTHEALLVECKTSPLFSARWIDEVAKQLRWFKTALQNGSLVLAVATRVNTQQRNAFKVQGIDVWDLDEIARRFADHLKGIEHPVLRPMLLGIASLQNPASAKTPEALLSEELVGLKAGRPTWSEYQRLIGRIFERAFVPPLSPPLTEHSDQSGRNRRDIVLPNYAETGFWSHLRTRYAADFIVVDAKNYVDKIGKEQALAMLHYLKEDGAGLFGILVTRKGPSEACMHALANHWIRHKKLVITLSDDDVLQMLRLKESQGSPETVIRQTIEAFRLSL